ncbi:hypothetical protein VNO77_24147 [Canavalia gladiata]|uniref:Uncharacterized protein n=1 Tax=Canavalia gladiata TaxID=3824 RepID=A0AAN9L938_CANGL
MNTTVPFNTALYCMKLTYFVVVALLKLWNYGFGDSRRNVSENCTLLQLKENHPHAKAKGMQLLNFSVEKSSDLNTAFQYLDFYMPLPDMSKSPETKFYHFRTLHNDLNGCPYPFTFVKIKEKSREPHSLARKFNKDKVNKMESCKVFKHWILT